MGCSRLSEVKLNKCDQKILLKYAEGCKNPSLIPQKTATCFFY